MIDETIGQSFIRTDGEGRVVTEIPTEEVAEVEQAIENIAANEEKQIADAADILAAFVPRAEVEVEAQEIFFQGQTLRVYVKKVGYKGSVRLNSKRYRKARSGQTTFDMEWAATNGLAHQIAECLVRDENQGKKDGHGKDLKPNWVPVYTLEKVESIMDPDDEEAKELIYSLLGAIWTTTPELNPAFQEQAANFLSGQ